MTAGDEIVSHLKTRFESVTGSFFRGQQRIVVSAEQLYDALAILKDEFGFDLLVDAFGFFEAEGAFVGISSSFAGDSELHRCARARGAC